MLLNDDKAEWHCMHIWNVQSSAKYKVFHMKEGLRKQINKQTNKFSIISTVWWETNQSAGNIILFVCDKNYVSLATV